MNRLFIKYYRLSAMALLLGVPMTGCSNQEYDDAYYVKVHTVTLLPKETKDPKATPPKPPFYEFKAAQGYLGGGSLARQTTFAEFKALYPDMAHFSPKLRSAWFEKSPSGEWGSEAKDVIRVFIEYSISGENDESLGIIRRINRETDSQGKKSFINGVPSKDLVNKIPDLKFYRYRFDKNGTEGYYVFRQGERSVAVNCQSIMECVAFTTWRGKLRVHYRFPNSRFPELVKLDASVSSLVDSFQPKLIEQEK